MCTHLQYALIFFYIYFLFIYIFCCFACFTLFAWLRVVNLVVVVVAVLPAIVVVAVELKKFFCSMAKCLEDVVVFISLSFCRICSASSAETSLPQGEAVAGCKADSRAAVGCDVGNNYSNLQSVCGIKSVKQDQICLCLARCGSNALLPLPLPLPASCKFVLQISTYSSINANFRRKANTLRIMRDRSQKKHTQHKLNFWI